MLHCFLALYREHTVYRGVSTDQVVVVVVCVFVVVKVLVIIPVLVVLLLLSLVLLLRLLLLISKCCFRLGAAATGQTTHIHYPLILNQDPKGATIH